MPTGRRYGIGVRSADLADGAEIARLLAGLGIACGKEEVIARWAAMRHVGLSAVLVATGYEGLSGLVALHWTPMLQDPHPVAQIGLLVVDAEERRRGIGRMLLKAATQAARTAGCDRIAWAIPQDHASTYDGAEAFCLATGFLCQGKVFGRGLRRRAGSPAA